MRDRRSDCSARGQGRLESEKQESTLVRRAVFSRSSRTSQPPQSEKRRQDLQCATVCGVATRSVGDVADESLGELDAAIVDQESLVAKKPVLVVGQVPGDLGHEGRVVCDIGLRRYRGYARRGGGASSKAKTSQGPSSALLSRANYPGFEGNSLSARLLRV